MSLKIITLKLLPCFSGANELTIMCQHPSAVARITQHLICFMYYHGLIVNHFLASIPSCLNHVNSYFSMFIHAHQPWWSLSDWHIGSLWWWSWVTVIMHANQVMACCPKAPSHNLITWTNVDFSSARFCGISPMYNFTGKCSIYLSLILV